MYDFILLLCLISICFSLLHAWKLPRTSRNIMVPSRKDVMTSTTTSTALQALVSPFKLPEHLIKPITLVVPIDANAQLDQLQIALQNLKFTPHYFPEVTDRNTFVQNLDSHDPYNHVFIINSNSLKEDDSWLQTINSIYFWFDYDEHESAQQRAIRHLCRYCLFLSTSDESGLAEDTHKSNHDQKCTTPHFLYAKQFHNYQRLKRLMQKVLLMGEFRPIDRNCGATTTGATPVITPQDSILPPITFPTIPPTAASLPTIPSIQLQTVKEPPETPENTEKTPSFLEYGGGKFSHFLSLVYPQYSNKSPSLFMKTLRQGVDAFEVRHDLLKPEIRNSEFATMKELAFLQAVTNLPLIFTIRTRNQLGQCADDAYGEIRRFQRLALQTGLDYLDLEANLPASYLTEIGELIRTQYSQVTKVIGSFHTPHSVAQATIEDMFTATALQGYADILKVVTGAHCMEDNLLVHAVGQRMSALRRLPYIGICVHQLGALSRILNHYFTPVTHASFTVPAAPGQLSASQCMTSRRNGHLAPTKNFYLFGHGIAHSLSPVMHSWAYDALLLPHVYALHEQSDVTAYAHTLGSADFGGASVTIPFKESIMPYLHGLHTAAKQIGAVNTIVVEEEEVRVGGEGMAEKGGNSEGIPSVKKEVVRKLIGYNTDWLGMFKPINALLLHHPAYQQYRQHRQHGTGNTGNTAAGNTGTDPAPRRLQGLVIGAGGTARAACFTLQQLGLDVLVANRNHHKAEALAQQFQGRAVRLEDLAEGVDAAALQVVISTVPAAAQVTLPPALYRNTPVVLDVVYKPARTPLLLQAQAHGCGIVQGATMLFEQATEQFRLWHRRFPPRDEMRKAVFSGTDKIDSL